MRGSDSGSQVPVCVHVRISRGVGTGSLNGFRDTSPDGFAERMDGNVPRFAKTLAKNAEQYRKEK